MPLPDRFTLPFFLDLVLPLVEVGVTPPLIGSKEWWESWMCWIPSAKRLRACSTNFACCAIMSILVDVSVQSSTSDVASILYLIKSFLMPSRIIWLLAMFLCCSLLCLRINQSSISRTAFLLSDLLALSLFRRITAARSRAVHANAFERDAASREANTVPAIAAEHATSLPKWVPGNSSPYPTVAVVTIMNHKLLQKWIMFSLSNSLSPIRHFDADSKRQ
mmetsp:Transcript_34609/g.84227  ORF Transcript_34609/g.84227 Transcript_34609/m.84227 type:complete len:220 (-) Transcript_34609:2761-3420(-)